MSEIETQLASEIRALRMRVEHLESLEYIAGAGAVDSIHAATTPTASQLLAMDANARFPSHDVTGDLGVTGGLTHKTGSLLVFGHDPTIGWKYSPADNTLFDVMTFTATANTAGRNYWGICGGILIFNIAARNTANNDLFYTISYQVLVACASTDAMKSVITPMFTSNTYIGSSLTTTWTLQEKAGASNTSLTLEAKLTHTAFSGPHTWVAYRWIGHHHGMLAGYLITPTLLQA